MQLWNTRDILTITRKLRIAFGASIVQLDQQGNETPFEAGVPGLTATATELNRTSDVSERLVTVAVDTDITIEEHEGRTVLMNSAVATELTLPAATGSGAKFRFIVAANNTNGYTIDVGTNGAILQGIATMTRTDDSPAPTLAPYSAGVGDSLNQVVLNGTSSGGRDIGDLVELEDIAENVYVVHAVLTNVGAGSSPFAGGT